MDAFLIAVVVIAVLMCLMGVYATIYWVYCKEPRPSYSDDVHDKLSQNDANDIA